ncbi:metal ABC transporter permease [Helcococcus kunzii]
MKLIFNYSFYIIAIGTVLLAIASSLVGSLNVYKGQSLIGDAMGHAAFPGIILAFMLSSSKNIIFMLIGAALSAGLSYILVEMSGKKSKIDLNSNLAIYLSGFFGLGLVLKTYILGNANFRVSSQAGLDNFIFGQAAYMLKSDIYLIAIVAAICLILITIYYKEFKISLFDYEYAKLVNCPVKKLETIQLLMTILIIAVGIKSVGVVLISSFLIIPNIIASQWSKKFINVLIIGALISSLAAFIGTYLSSAINDFSTGPTIIIILGFFCIFSFVFGKKRREKK